jgi:hypothetical protein
MKKTIYIYIYISLLLLLLLFDFILRILWIEFIGIGSSFISEGFIPI